MERRTSPRRVLAHSPVLEGSERVRAPRRLGARHCVISGPLATSANGGRGPGARSCSRAHQNGVSRASTAQRGLLAGSEISHAANARSSPSTMSRIARWPMSPSNPRGGGKHRQELPGPGAENTGSAPWRSHCESGPNRKRCLPGGATGRTQHASSSDGPVASTSADPDDHTTGRSRTRRLVGRLRVFAPI